MRAVIETARIWDLEPLDNTLDFNPLMLYHKEMTANEMMLHINEIIPRPISYDTAKLVISNIVRYYDLRAYLLEEELKEERDVRKGTT